MQFITVYKKATNKKFFTVYDNHHSPYDAGYVLHRVPRFISEKKENFN